MEGLEILREQGERKATIGQPGRHSEPTVGPLDVALGAAKAPGSPELVGSTDTSFPTGPMSIQSQEALTPGDQRKSLTSVGMKRDVFLWGLGPLMFTSPLSAQQYVPLWITGTGGHPLPLSWQPEAACPGYLCFPHCLPNPTPPHLGTPPSLLSQSDPDTLLSSVDFVDGLHVGP